MLNNELPIKFFEVQLINVSFCMYINENVNYKLIKVAAEDVVVWLNGNTIITRFLTYFYLFNTIYKFIWHHVNS